MRQKCGQRRRKAEAVRKHVVFAGLAKLTPIKLIAVEDLAKNRFGAGQIDVVLFDGRSGWIPAAFGDVLLEARVVGGIVLLHEPVAVGPGPVEDVMRILVDVVEVEPHRLQQVFADGLRELPAPLRVEMRVGHDIERGLPGDVRRLHGLSGCGYGSGQERGGENC